MFCPQCGSQNDTLRFCKSCGVNLEAVRQAATARDPNENFDWNKTWVTEMFLSHSERKRRKEEIERERGITPEVKRYTEIKAGVITSSAGIGVMIFLHALMLGMCWRAEIIPFSVGLALIINGLFVSKRQVEIARRMATADGVLKASDEPSMLNSADTNEFITPRFGVTEGTTKHLSTPAEK